jgi:fermentation-respiration switch protein FrsA (DUF1100 family)
MDGRGWIVGIGVGMASLLAGCVEGLFFHPDQRVYATPQQLGIAVQDVFFDSGGVRLHGWWMPASGAVRATLVQAHGNAANVSNHAPLVSWLPAHGVQVLCFDYRGFGRSEGSPSLDGVVADTRAALDEARRRAGPGARLVLLGQSLGGASAIRVAAEVDDLRLLVIDSAFASYRGIARDAAAASPLALLAPLAGASLPDASRDPEAAIARVRAPLLLLHGERDEVIPIRHSERLHAAARAPRQFVRIPDGRHLDALTRETVRQRILASIAALP